MCIGSNRNSDNRPVTFDDTIIYAGEYLRTVQREIPLPVFQPMSPAPGTGHTVVEHILAYFNKVKVGGAGKAKKAGDRKFGWRVQRPKGNAMLLAVPAKPGTVTASSLIPLTPYPNIMKDYKRTVSKSRSVNRSSMDYSLPKSASAPIVVSDFDGGTYDVVISPSAGAIASVIGQVDAAKRPELNEPLWAELDRLYPEWTFLLFCFTEEEDSKAGCAAVKYLPMREDLIYAPGLDGHKGIIEWGNVDVNHTLIFGSNRMKDSGRKVAFTDQGLQAAHPYFSDTVLGAVYEGLEVPQGDFLIDVDDLRKGELRVKRELPPGAADHLHARHDFYMPHA